MKSDKTTVLDQVLVVMLWVAMLATLAMLVSCSTKALKDNSSIDLGAGFDGADGGYGSLYLGTSLYIGNGVSTSIGAWKALGVSGPYFGVNYSFTPFKK